MLMSSGGLTPAERFISLYLIPMKGNPAIGHWRCRAAPIELGNKMSPWRYGRYGLMQRMRRRGQSAAGIV